MIGSSGVYIPMYSRSVGESTKPTRSLTIADRKDLFDRINKFVTARSGWITSTPGAREVRMECLPGSTLPEELRKMGYEVTEIGEGERILPTAITERLAIGADGQLEPLTDGSTRPVARVVTQCGDL